MIKELWHKYKEITIDIIEDISDVKKVQALMTERERTLKEIKALEIGAKELKAEYDKQNIGILDEELKEILNEEREKVRELVQESKARRRAYNSYYSTMRNSNLFSRKV